MPDPRKTTSGADVKPKRRKNDALQTVVKMRAKYLRDLGRSIRRKADRLAGMQYRGTFDFDLQGDEKARYFACEMESYIRDLHECLCEYVRTTSGGAA